MYVHQEPFSAATGLNGGGDVLRKFSVFVGKKPIVHHVAKRASAALASSRRKFSGAFVPPRSILSFLGK